MLFRLVFVLLFVSLFAGSASAVVKSYDSSGDNGLSGDVLNSATNLCPPVQTQPGDIQGFATLSDDATGTVTLDEMNVLTVFFGDLGPDQLEITFGPGAFVFIDARASQFPGTGHVSNDTGLGAHGPSGTAPSESVEWGIVSGWSATGYRFCVSSPIGICNNAGFSHGVTVGPIVNSSTYDLGTWTFDTEGDYEDAAPYIFSSANGGLQNIRYDLRGAFAGTSLPALPLVGFGVLAAALATLGARGLRSRGAPRR